jgi:TctA family transporter
MMIRIATKVLRAPRSAIMPIVVLCCAAGTFAAGNNLFAVACGAVFGIVGFFNGA